MNGNPVTLPETFFDNHPIYSNITPVLIDDQYMVRIPKFYVKYETISSSNDPRGLPLNAKIKYLSPVKLPGYHIYPAFMYNEEEIDQYYIGQYSGSTLGSKLQSVPNVNPSTNYILDKFKSYANGRNVNNISGFMIQNIYQRAAIQLLFLAEYANPDIQSILGNGNVNNSTYVITSSNLNTIYRNIYSLYGNIWEIVDGLKANSNRNLEIYSNTGSYQYINTNLLLFAYTTDCNNWIVDMSTNNGNGFNLEDIFLPRLGDLTYSNGTYSDVCNGANANGILLVGGGYNIRQNGGLFCSVLNILSSNTFDYMGTRLAKI